MYWINVYKTSRSAGGLLTNSYYADVPEMSPTQFWNWAYQVKAFDACFTASDTNYLAITGTPQGNGAKWPGSATRLWAPAAGALTGNRRVSQPLPWRWTLGVSLFTGSKTYGRHAYHDAISKEELEWDSKGNVVFRVEPDGDFYQNGERRPIAGNYRDWLRVGTGNATPGEAFDFLAVTDAIPTGVPVKNKARRAQRLILKEAITFQLKAVGIMSATGLMLSELFLLHSEDVGGWVRAELRTVTVQLMGMVLAMVQAFADLEKGENDQTINEGEGWKSRFGVTSASISGELDFFKKKQRDDLKFLQLFPTFTDAGGDEWFTNENAQQWFLVADEWSQYAGIAGGFDFLNPAQKGLKDMERLDNYTQHYPDLPYRVDGLPRPQKNPKRKVEPLGLIV